MKFGYFFTVPALFILSSLALAGSETQNGGDYIAQDFVTSAQNGLRFLQSSDEFRFVDMVKVQEAIRKTKVLILPSSTSFPDAVVTAEYSGSENAIQVDGDRWQKVGDPSRKMALSLHQYLGLTGYEINNYILTSELFGIDSGQMELPPTLAQLDHSFDSRRKSYLNLLDTAQALPGILILRPGKILSTSKCLKFVKNNIMTPPDFDSKFLCEDTTVKLFDQKGVNSLGLPFMQILGVGFWDVKDPEITYYFIDSKGKVIESMKKGVDNQDGTIFSYECIAALDLTGNAYAHNILHPYEHSDFVSREEVYVVLGDGSSGSGLSRIVTFQSNATLSDVATTFSTTDTKNWRLFNLELLPYLPKGYESETDQCGPYPENDICRESYAGFDGDTLDMTFSYEYMGNWYGLPDDFRQVTYHADKTVPTSGKYVSGRRAYKIKN